MTLTRCPVVVSISLTDPEALLATQSRERLAVSETGRPKPYGLPRSVVIQAPETASISVTEPFSELATQSR